MRLISLMNSASLDMASVDGVVVEDAADAVELVDDAGSAEGIVELASAGSSAGFSADAAAASASASARWALDGEQAVPSSRSAARPTAVIVRFIPSSWSPSFGHPRPPMGSRGLTHLSAPRPAELSLRSTALRGGSERGVGGVDEVGAAQVAGQADVHAVHDVAEAELGVGIGPADRAAGTVVAEAARPVGDDRRGHHEAEAELHVHVEQDDVRARRALGRGLLHLLGAEGAEA